MSSPENAWGNTEVDDDDANKYDMNDDDDDEPLLGSADRRRSRPHDRRLKSRLVPWCCWKRIYCCSGILGFLGVFFLTGSVVLFVSFRHLYDYIVSKSVVLAPGTEIYNMWEEPPIPIYMKVYLFNITNRDDFPWKTTKPAVEEIGPYVFREHWKRVAVEWHPNGTVSYRTVRTYFFEPTLSAGSEDDMVIALNVPVVTVASMVKTFGSLTKLALSSFLMVLRESFFVRRSVKQMLFEGYDDPLIKLAHDILGVYPFEKFGYLVGRNGSNDGLFNIHTGYQNVEDFGRIDGWNGDSSTHVWPSKYCNMINGTDGTLFPPFIEETQVLQVFIPDMCRSLKAKVVGTTELLNIPAYKFEIDKELLDNGATVPGTECFCGDGACMKPGVFNVSQCKFGAPILLSFPHFLDADPSYAANLDGMHPDKERHLTTFLIEPMTGIPLHASARFQINIYMERIPGFTFFDKIPSMVFPLLWFEEGAGVTPEIANLVVQATQLPFYYGKIVTYCLLALGLILVLSSILYFIVSRKHDRTMTIVTPK